jgi:hypothetical protein
MIVAWVIRPASSPGGPRPRRGPIEWAQYAICALHPRGLPRDFSPSKLTRDIEKRLKGDRERQLNGDPEFLAAGLKPPSRQTVLRAVELLRTAND